MVKIKKLKNWKIVYTSEKRYHSPDYPYRIGLEDRGEEIVLLHQYIHHGEWVTSHSIGLMRKDISTMLKTIEK